MGWIEGGETSYGRLDLVRNRVPERALKFNLASAFWCSGVVSTKKEIAAEAKISDYGCAERE